MNLFKCGLSCNFFCIQTAFNIHCDSFTWLFFPVNPCFLLSVISHLHLRILCFHQSWLCLSLGLGSLQAVKDKEAIKDYLCEDLNNMVYINFCKLCVKRETGLWTPSGLPYVPSLPMPIILFIWGSEHNLENILSCVIPTANTITT